MQLSPADAVSLMANAVQFGGVLVVALSALYAISAYGKAFVLDRGTPQKIEHIRLRLGRGLVFGLEFLIAADILRTVLSPSFQDVALLAAIIVIRTILSLTLEYELGNLRRPR